MNKIIPRDKIKHLEWSNSQDILETKPPESNARLKIDTTNLVGRLLSDGKEFFDDSKVDGKWVGVQYALKSVVGYVGEDGIIASMPLYIASKIEADKDHSLWKKWFTTYSEELVGVDTEGTLGNKGEAIVVTVHGGGILTPDRIRQAYKEGLNDRNAARLSQDEFNSILSKRATYSVDSLKHTKLVKPFDRYITYLSLEEAKTTNSGYQERSQFLNNPLIIARNGGTQNLEAYFDKAKGSGSKVGNWHRLKDINQTEPSGRLLFLYSGINGLVGDCDLNINGRFLGVAPEARAKK
jgi:hypothetical protein